MGMFEDALRAEIPSLNVFLEQGHPLYRRSILELLQMPDTQPSTPAILDLIEFCWKSVGKPTKIGDHSYFSHHHLTFDEDAGRRSFAVKLRRSSDAMGLPTNLRRGSHRAIDAAGIPKHLGRFGL